MNASIPMSAPVVHFEIPDDDLARAKAFYSAAFEWRLQQAPGLEYVLAGTTPIDAQQRPATPGAINGGILRRQAPIKSPVITINVNSIDAAAKKIVKAGGRIVREKLAVGTMGFAAYFTDTEGNVLGLFEAAAAR
jgi:uncharacterized protein